MRNLSKCKLFLCFRPVVDIDSMLESKVSDKLHGTKKSEAKSVFFQQGSTKFSKSWIMKQPPKKTLYRAIKAVVFETMLNRRAHHKNRYLHDSFGSKHSYGSETKLATQSPLSSSSSSSYGSTSPYSSSPKALLESSKNVSNKCHPTKQKQKEKQNKFECYGIYLVLISLVFTVFWGKLFGIILTSMLLYFSSLWNSSSYYCSQKRLPSYPRSIKAKGRGRCHCGGSYIRSAPRELP